MAGFDTTGKQNGMGHTNDAKDSLQISRETCNPWYGCKDSNVSLVKDTTWERYFNTVGKKIINTVKALNLNLRR